MSVQNIERYIQELEAIKNYSKVVKERDELSRKVGALEASLRNASEELARYEELKVRLVDSGEISLDAARHDFLTTMEGEIEKRAAARFESLKQEYEATMPQRIYERLVEALKGRLWPKEIATVIRAEVEKRVNDILYNSESWPEGFREYCQKEVEAGIKSGLDSEFDRRVEEGAEAKARQRLGELKNEEWPRWLKANIEPRIGELQAKINDNDLRLLKGPWTFTCDRCGTKFDAELTASGIGDLLAKGQVRIQCSNAACEDSGWLSRRRHTFTVSLHELIQFYISGGP